MSLSSQNNVVTPDNCCESVYKICNGVSSCSDYLHIKTGLISSEVTVRLVDKFKKVLYLPAETDSLGYAVVDLTELKGLLNEYAGMFRVSVISNGDVVMFDGNDGKKYEAIDFDCRATNPWQKNAYIDISK